LSVIRLLFGGFFTAISCLTIIGAVIAVFARISIKIWNSQGSQMIGVLLGAAIGLWIALRAGIWLFEKIALPAPSADKTE
jgi:hypothetical protein